MATIIDTTTAKSLIQEYQAQNAAAGGPAIKTHEGHLLHGYFLDRESLEAILSNPKAIGVSLHLAKHSSSVGSPDNHFTVLYSAAEPNTAPNAATAHVSTGDVYGDPPPCPSVCSNLT